MVLVAIAMVAIIAMAALSIDVITLYLAREEAQRSADAAALAAARVISISGMTGDPANTATWQAICGGPTSPASQTAAAVATESGVGSSVAGVTVMYSAGGGTASDCSTVTSGAFGVNPMVTVQVTRSNLPTFFSRIWGNTGNSVSATAAAEAFNPSASDINTNGGTSGAVTPVQPSCVKPWVIPNLDPGNPAACTGTTCGKFVSLADGSIQNPGVSTATTPAGVIGENFNLFADCAAGGSCSLLDASPTVDSTKVGSIPTPPQSLEYLPGSAQNPSVAVPSCAAGTGANPDYVLAVAGCDQSTVYQCGLQTSIANPANSVDLSENPGGPAGDTATGIACLINQSSQGSVTGQDTLNTSSYPYQIMAGTANPNVAVRGNVVTSSNSIVSLPIYDNTTVSIGSTGTTSVMIVGFLQVFVNQINSDGSLNVTVLNVAGCGNNASNRAVTGSSPVPIRIVTPQ